MLDLIVQGGLVVTPDGTSVADIGVADGKIAAVAAPGALKEMKAARVIDARDRVVIPGGIDPHIHCNWPVQPPKDGKPGIFSDGPEIVSRAALYGGTTTLI